MACPPFPSAFLSAVGRAKAEAPAMEEGLAKEAGLRILPQMNTERHRGMSSVKFCGILWLKVFMRRIIAPWAACGGTKTGFPATLHHSNPRHSPSANFNPNIGQSKSIKVNQSKKNRFFVPTWQKMAASRNFHRRL